MRKKTVAILAPTGMLGSMVYNILKNTYNLVLIYRNKEKLKKIASIYGGLAKHTTFLFDLTTIYQDYLDAFPASLIGPNTQKLINGIGDIDAVINCAGITKPHSLKNPAITFFINGGLPHILSTIYKNKLIHITTDCVFNGISGAPYDEDAPKTPNDLYGISKSLGEPKESLVLRASIMGPEIDNYVLLIEWLKQQKGKTIQGFTNHLWNGLTSKQLALACDQIIHNRNSFPKSGIYHIFSSPLSKYETLLRLRKRYNIDVQIKPAESTPIDRRLSSKYDVCHKLNIPSLEKMIEEL